MHDRHAARPNKQHLPESPQPSGHEWRPRLARVSTRSAYCAPQEEEEIRPEDHAQYLAAKRRDTTVSRTVQWPQKTSAFARRAYTSMEAEPSVSAEAGNRPFAQIGTSYVQSCVANAIDPPPGGRAAFARD